MSDRPDVSVVLPGVPWQELARRYEVALRELAKFKNVYGNMSDYGDWVRRVASDALAPAPSATTAETASAVCTACDVYSNSPCQFHAPPSSAGEATAPCATPGCIMWSSHAPPCCTGEQLIASISEKESILRERDDARDQLATARAEVERITRALEAGLSPLDRHCADFLADEVAALVRRKVIDSRSPAADALLDYRNPPSSPRADRLVKLEAERDAATKRAESVERERDEWRNRHAIAVDEIATQGKRADELQQQWNAETMRTIQALKERDEAREQRDEADAAAGALIELAAAANYFFVASPGNPIHGPAARDNLDQAFLALWKLLGVDENTPFSRDPYGSARRLISDRLPGAAASILLERDDLRREVERLRGVIGSWRPTMLGAISVAVTPGMIDAALTPPAPSNSDGEKGGGQ